MARRRTRDHRAEYARRIERLMSQGFTRSQARGHPTPAEGRLGVAAIKQMRRVVAADTEARKQYGVSGALRGSAKREAARDAVADVAGVRDQIGDTRPDSRAVKRFVKQFLDLGLGSEREAYTLWFSP